MARYRTHDKNMLVLLYKHIFMEDYPLNEYQVIFDPVDRPVQNLYFLPDILITKNDKLVMWIEVGSLDFNKARKVINAVGKERFKHIPYEHQIFRINEHNSKRDTVTIMFTKVTEAEESTKKQIVDLIEKTLGQENHSVTKTAHKLGLTIDQLKYRMKKYGIKRNH